MVPPPFALDKTALGVRCYSQMSLSTVSATMMPESASGGVQESALLMLVFANTMVMEEGR